ncbi:scarecrow-like transcription factor 11 (SCL11) isoform X1 [Carex rostrata]
MAKRELSNTLRNLKFMQRGAAAQQTEKLKRGANRENEIEKEKIDKSDLNSPFVDSSVSSKKCMVIIEGNPNPGAIKGRMSFGKFNPSIDKLNEASVSNHESGSSPSSPVRVERSGSRNPGTESGSDLKRKPGSESETPTPNKLQKNKDGDTSSQPSSSNENSGKKSKGIKMSSKRDKLDWNVLRPSRKP